MGHACVYTLTTLGRYKYTLNHYSHYTHTGQFILYYRGLGVSHFTFYSTRGLGPRGQHVLERLSAAGLSIELLPWNCKHKKFHLHAQNQYMAVNACLYWHMPFYEYSVVVDVDEYISARGMEITALSKLLESLDRMNNDTEPAAYLFRHFLLSIPNTTRDAIGMSSLGPQLPDFTERQDKANDPGVRSKVIYRPARVVSGTIHTVGQTVPPYRQILVNPELAALFHTRKQPLDGTETQTKTTDYVMRKYRPILEIQLAHEFMKDAAINPEANNC